MTPKKAIMPTMYSSPAEVDMLVNSKKNSDGAPLVFFISSSLSLFISSLKSYTSDITLLLLILCGSFYLNLPQRLFASCFLVGSCLRVLAMSR